MSSSKIGSAFEIITKDFFVWLFENINLSVIKDRIQFSGTQDGFDVQIVVVKDYIEHNIIFECKNYSKNIAISQIIQKAAEYEINHRLINSNDLFIAINPKTKFRNQDNANKSEPILNTKFPFKIQLLDTTNGIKELFALHPQFYKEIYKEEVSFPVDKAKIIRRFKNILFSRKPLQPIVINEKDKEKYIGAITATEHYISRTFSDDRNDTNNHIFFLGEKPKELKDIIEENDKIFILGNPGLGKTTSLKEFAIKHLKTGEQKSFVPIYKNLRNFTNNSSISDYLPKVYKKLHSVYLILDGIDEISDIEDFKSKLEIFIENEKHKNIKYIISCRTNIYTSTVKNILDFKVFFMDDLSFDESKSLLYGLTNKKIDSQELYQLSEFLKNPYQIKLSATYINEKGKLTTNTAKLWKTYINKRLKDDESKLEKKKFDITIIKEHSKKIALVNELMKTSTFEEKHLYSILDKDQHLLQQYKDNPLIDREIENPNWFFENKNIQEYFAALALSELSFNEIIDFITIPNTNKTHPTLLNTISFLINILDKKSETYTEIVNWLINNEPELLFHADKERVSSKIRAKVFQAYFKDVVLDKTLWLWSNKDINISQMSHFASCNENYIFLVEILKNHTKYHPRVASTVLEIFKNFTIYNNDSFKKLLLQLIKQPKFEISLKAKTIKLINEKGYAINDKEYLNEIFHIFKGTTHSSINRSLIYLLEKHPLPDEYFDFIENEFLLANKITKRKEDDNVIRGNQRAINDLVLKLQTPENIIKVIGYFFGDNMSFNHIDENYIKSITERCSTIFIKNENLIESLLNNIDINKLYIEKQDLLSQIISKSKLNKRVLKYLFKDYSKNKHLIAKIVNDNTIEWVALQLLNLKKSNSINDLEIEYTRNFIGNTNNRSLAVKFHSFMIDNDVVFKEPVYTEDDVKLYIENYKIQIQYNFDILFNKKQLIKDINNVFIDNKLTRINHDQFFPIKTKWYDKNGHSNQIDIALSVISDYIFRYTTVTFEFIAKEIDESYLIEKIKNSIEHKNDKSVQFTIKKEQEKYLKEWCYNTVERIDFNKIIQNAENYTFRYLSHYKNLNTVFFFQELFNLKLPKDFLLNSIQYYELEKFNQEQHGFLKLKEMIADEVSFNKRVIDNLKSKTLVASSLSKHIDYAIDNKLSETYPEVRAFFLEDQSVFNEIDLLEKYIELTEDYDLLKESCHTTKYICWSAIDILIKNEVEKEFCIDKAIAYLNSDEDMYRENAIQVLITLNHPTALDFFIDGFKKEKPYSTSLLKLESYSNIVDIQNLYTLYDIVYFVKHDDFNRSFYHSFFRSIVINLSKDDVQYKHIQKLLNTKKQETVSENLDVFYVNLLIEESKSSYINSNSKALTFKEALKKVNEILV